MTAAPTLIGATASTTLPIPFEVQALTVSGMIRQAGWMLTSFDGNRGVCRAEFSKPGGVKFSIELTEATFANETAAEVATRLMKEHT